MRGGDKLRGMRTDRGNVLLMVVMLMVVFSVFGAAIASRFLVDAHITAQEINSTRAFYLAESGIQWARRYLVNNSNSTTLGPVSLGGGTVRVQIIQTTLVWPRWGNNYSVYQIVSTGTVGNAKRTIEEFRARGGSHDKKLIFWREVVSSQFEGEEWWEWWDWERWWRGRGRWEVEF